MQGVDNKKVFLIIGLFVVGMSLYNYFTQYQATETNTVFREYIEAEKKILSSADSVKVADFYKKVEAIYKKVSLDSNKTKDFSNIAPERPAIEADLQLVSLGLLDYTFDGPFVSARMSISKEEYYAQVFSTTGSSADALINLYFGEASFPFDFSHRRWHAGFLTEIKQFEKIRYLSVLSGLEYNLPEIIGESTYKSGSFKGILYVIDLKNFDIAAKVNIEAYNEKELSLSKYIQADALKKLNENLQQSVVLSVSAALEKLLGKKLVSPEMKIYGLKKAG